MKQYERQKIMFKATSLIILLIWLAIVIGIIVVIILEDEKILDNYEYMYESYYESSFSNTTTPSGEISGGGFKMK